MAYEIKKAIFQRMVMCFALHKKLAGNNQTNGENQLNQSLELAQQNKIYIQGKI